MALDSVPNVAIDEGVFKYVSIEVSDGTNSKTIVRGTNEAEYHDDIFQPVSQQLTALGLSASVKGGGRIEHVPGEKIYVYGYSVAFGRADHAETVKLLQEKYPQYDKIYFRNEGY